MKEIVPAKDTVSILSLKRQMSWYCVKYVNTFLARHCKEVNNDNTLKQMSDHY